MKPLHLCVVMTDSYFPIYQNMFSRVLPRDFNSVNILHVRDYDSRPGLVGEPDFKTINYKKLEFVAKQLVTHEGDNLLVLDIDIICFRSFKQEINKLLESNDMVFQCNPPGPTTLPYGIGVWALQCSRKNMMFFEKEVLTRGEVLLYGDRLNEFFDNKVPVPLNWMHSLNGHPEHYAGDQCVINAAILESDLGKELNVSLLPDTYALSGQIDFNSSKDYALYHATNGGQTAEEKAKTLSDVYHKMANRAERMESK